MPFPDNTPGIDELINLPAGEIALLPVDLLAAMQREIDAAAKQMKAVTARFNTALEVRFAKLRSCSSPFAQLTLVAKERRREEFSYSSQLVASLRLPRTHGGSTTHLSVTTMTEVSRDHPDTFLPNSWTYVHSCLDPPNHSWTFRGMSLSLRHLPSRKRSSVPAAAGFFCCFRGLCARPFPPVTPVCDPKAFAQAQYSPRL